MKKTFTLLALIGILMIPFTMNAQTDITPQRYIFPNVPEGPYSLDKQYNGFNAPNNDMDVKDHWNFGFLTIGSTRMINSLEFTDGGEGDILNSYFQIFDMGGEVGKVLMMKGSGSNFDYGVAGDPGYSNSWWNMRWYTDPNNTPTVDEFITAGDDALTAQAKATVRMRMVFQIHEDPVSTDKTQRFFQVAGYRWSGDYKTDISGTVVTSENFISGDFATGGVYDPEKWIVYEYDYYAFDPSHLPLSYNLAFKGVINGTLLIKEFSMTSNPVGEPVREEITLTPGVSTDISSVIEKMGFTSYTKDGRLYLENITPGTDVAVYSISGMLVESFNAQVPALSLPLSSGAYIVRVGKETKKVIVQ